MLVRLASMSDSPVTAPPPSRPGWPYLIATALIGLALIGDAVRLYVEGRTAPMAHLVALPLLPFWIAAAVVFVISLGIALRAMTGHIAVRWARLPVIVLTLMLFTDAFVLPEVRSSLPALDVALVVESLAEGISNEGPGPLPTTVEQLLPVVKDLGAPFLLDHGQRPDTWALVVRQGCTGPADSASGLAPGTLIYCLRADGKRAWITAVGPSEAMFGPTGIASTNGQPITSVVNTQAEEPPAPPPPALDAGARPDAGSGAESRASPSEKR